MYCYIKKNMCMSTYFVSQNKENEMGFFRKYWQNVTNNRNTFKNPPLPPPTKNKKIGKSEIPPFI